MYSNPGTQRRNIIVHTVVGLGIVVSKALPVIQRKWIAAHERRQWMVHLVAEHCHLSMGSRKCY